MVTSLRGTTYTFDQILARVSAGYVNKRHRAAWRSVGSKRNVPRKQCKLCPWRTDVDPYDIPNGYCSTKHAALSNTIAGEPLASIGGQLRMMACHETKLGKELPCVGWLANQLGPGNNIGLRLAVCSGENLADFELVGEQHERFEDTLPDDMEHDDQ